MLASSDCILGTLPADSVKACGVNKFHCRVRMLLVRVLKKESILARFLMFENQNLGNFSQSKRCYMTDLMKSFDVKDEISSE